MILPKMAFRNLRRNKRRTFLTAMVVALGSGVLFFVTSFSDGSYDEFLKILAHTVTGDIKVRSIDYKAKERMLPVDITIDLSLEEKIMQQPSVRLVIPRTTFGTMLWVGKESKEAVGMGLDIEKEKTILALQDHLIEGRYFSSSTAAETLVSYKLAAKLGIKAGDEITLLTSTSFGSMAALNLQVAGITKLGMYMYDDNFFFLPHPVAERLLDNKGLATEILVYMDKKQRHTAPRVAKAITAETFAATGQSDLEVIPWQKDKLMSVVVMQRDATDIILKMIIIFITAITIFNTMLVSVMERFGEFGVLKALGLRDNATLRLVLLEGLLIGVLGSLFGILLFLYPTWYFEYYGWDIADMLEGFNMPAQTIWRAKMSWNVFFTSVSTGVFGAVLASIPPALRARKMEPVDALRKINS